MAKTPNKVSPFARFERASPDIKPRIVASSYGEVGTGKTHFWLGAPAPIVVQTLDQGLEGVVEQYAKEKDIYLANYDLGATIGASFTHAAAVEARDKFIEDFETAIQSARTIVWDRETDVFDLFYFAEFGTDDAFGAAGAKDWDKLKGKLRRMIAMAKASDINFGLIQGMRNEWVAKANKNTGAKAAAQSGNRIRKGMDDIEALVHIDLLHTRQNGEFSIEVKKSRGPGGTDVQDQTFEGLSFTDFALLVFPDTSEKDWA